MDSSASPSPASATRCTTPIAARCPRLARAENEHLGDVVPDRRPRLARSHPAGVRALGARHVQYDVKSSDYAVFGQALIDTLQIGLGAGFSAEVSEAWLAVYTLLTKTMQSDEEEAIAS